MPKIRRKLINEFTKSKKLYFKNKKEIMSKFEDVISKKYNRNIWKITDVELCYDEYINPEVAKSEKIWVEISEDEYDSDNRNGDDWKIKYEYEPEFKERYFRKEYKKYEYIKIWVHESWGYGGNDDVSYDFLVSDILDEKDKRKEKLKSLMV